MNDSKAMRSDFVMQSEVAVTRRILRAAHLGMCFGVRDAIALAVEKAAEKPLTILGELVHNETVVNGLAAKGIRSEDEPAKVQTEAVMITAHGASDKAMERVKARGLEVFEATCPLVHYAHKAVAKLVAEGFHPVIIGKRGHVEVRGLTEDLEAYDIVLTEEEIRQLPPHRRFGVAAQTTQPIDRVRHLVELIRAYFPASEVRLIDTVCQPTKQRQSAAIDMAQESDVVVVVGGLNSNNTRELVATCRKYCEKVFHIQHAAELHGEWFDGANTIGLTAGTSTPDNIIDDVEGWLNRYLVRSRE